MSIPLDRLYHYIESIAQDVCKSNIVIYRFYPHGSKKIEDLQRLTVYPWKTSVLSPEIYCNDQEPLNYDYYESNPRALTTQIDQLVAQYLPSAFLNNFRQLLSIWDRAILLHSEQRSANVEKYSYNGFIPVYYWSHAVISRDWFRYAEHVGQKKKVEQIFLVYNRAWSGTREYRLGFADRLIMSGLVDSTLMRISPVDPTIDKHYDLHAFEHAHWRPNNVIEKYFPLCKAESYYSADFDQTDYESTDIEVVLETLFDDLRLHLTEKTLRPIAMGQPFILAGTYGSLKYLHGYGFKTFSNCWDESYDMMSDSIERMNKIIEVMSNIVSMPLIKREEMLARACAIAEYNKRHFFSEEFKKQVENELINNMSVALTELEKTNTSQVWIDRRKKMLEFSELKAVITGQVVHPNFNNYPGVWESHTRNNIASVVNFARQYYLRSLSKD